MKQLAIIGACGHGKVLADIAIKMGYVSIFFYDDFKTIKEYGGYPVVGKTCKINQNINEAVVAIGNAKIRQKFQEMLIKKFIRIPVLIHPNAIIASDVIIGQGTVIMPGVVISPGSIIGNGCIINTCASVDHDCIVQDYVHVAVGAHLAGEVKIGERTWVGAGAIVSNNISICYDCMLGAGSVVVRDIKTSGTYIGVPARKMK